MPQVAQRRIPITVEAYTEGTQQALGTMPKTWKPVGRAWAMFQTTGREFLRAQQVQGEMTHLITFDFLEFRDLSRYERLRIRRESGNDRNLEVLSAVNQNEENKMWALSCKEQV